MRFTESTQRLISALREVERIDLDKLHASAIDVILPHYTDPEQGRVHVDRVSIPAEFMGPVRTALREALLETLRRREQFLCSDLSALRAAIAR